MGNSKITPVFGIGQIQWREVGEKPTNESDWERNRTCPNVGETRWANIRSPHQTALGSRIWLLYQPEPSAWCDWADCPQHLDLSFIIEAEILERWQAEWSRDSAEKFQLLHPDVKIEEPPADEYRGWAKVYCHQVVGLIDIPNHFYPTENKSPVFSKYPTFAEGTKQLTYSWRWCDYEQNAREWWIVINAESTRLVLYSPQDDGFAPFEICNCAFKAIHP